MQLVQFAEFIAARNCGVCNTHKSRQNKCIININKNNKNKKKNEKKNRVYIVHINQ